MSSGWRDLLLYEGDPRTTYGDRFKALRAEAAAGHAAEVLDEALEMAVGLHLAGLDQEALELLDELSTFVTEADVRPEQWPWFFNTLGTALGGLGRHEQAEARYLEMQQLAEKLPDDEIRRWIVSTALQNRGIIALEAHDAERAIPLLRQAGEMKQELGDVVAAVDVLNSFAMAVAETGELERAEEILDSVEELARLLKDPRRIGAAFGNRGAVRARRGEYQGAEMDLRAALRYARAEGDGLRELQGMMGVGSSLVQQGQLGRGLRWYRRAARLAGERHIPMMELPLRRSAAITLLRMGRAAEAVPELNRAVEVARGVGSAQLAAECLADLGALHVELGEDESAERELREAREQFEALGDEAWRARVDQNLAELKRRQAGAGEAETFWSEAFELLAASPEEAADVAHRAAESWVAEAQFDAAERWFMRELDQAARFEAESALAWRTAIAGTLLNVDGKTERGLALLQDAVGRYERVGDAGQATRVRLDVATALSDLGHHEEAIAELERCLDYARRHADRATRRHSLGNLAEVLRRVGDLERALAAAEEAGSLAVELGDEDALAHSLGNLGLIQFQSGDIEAARATFERQLELATRLRARDAKASALGGLGDVELSAGHFRRAASLFRKAADLRAGVWAVGEVENLGSLLYSLASAKRYDELEEVAQRLADVAQASGLEDRAAVSLAESARVLLNHREREGAASFYSASLRLNVGDDPDAPNFSDEAMNTLIYRLGLMAAHVEADLPDEERSSFYDIVLALIADETDDAVGAALRRLLDQVRESFEEQGVFDRWREVKGDSERDPS